MEKEAMRINLEEKFWGDPRVFALSVAAGDCMFATRGRLLTLWHVCFIERSDVLSDSQISDATLREGYGEHMVKAKLAEKVDGGYRIRGVNDQMQYLLRFDEQRANAGRARAAKSQRGSDGKYLPSGDPAATSENQREPAKTSSSSSSSSSSSASASVKNTKLKPTAAPSGAAGKGTPVWAAYHQAYLKRWGVLLPRNAQHSTICARLVDRYGQEDATAMAEFYPSHNDRFYVGSKHPLTLLLRDGDKIFGDMKTRRQTTATEAQGADLRTSNVQAVRDYLNEKEQAQ